MPNAPRSATDGGLIPGPMIQRARGRPDPRPLQEHGHAPPRPALDALPRRAVPAQLGRRLHARLLGPRRQREARPDLDLQARAGEDSAGVWPYHDHSPSMDDSIAGGMYGDALDPRAGTSGRPTASSWSSSRRWHDFMTIDGRAFVGNTPVFRAKVGQLVQWDVMAIGTTSTPSTSTATAGSTRTARRRTRDGRPRGELPRPLARGRARHVALPLPRRGAHDDRG